MHSETKSDVYFHFFFFFNEEPDDTLTPRHISQSRGNIMPSVQEVEELLRTALEATEVDVTDISGEYVSASVTSRPPRLFPRP